MNCKTASDTINAVFNIAALVSKHEKELAEHERRFKELARMRVKRENEIECARRKIDIIDREAAAEHEKIAGLSDLINNMRSEIVEELFG